MYVGNDPLNRSDPTGRQTQGIYTIRNSIARIFQSREERATAPTVTNSRGQQQTDMRAPVAEPTVPDATVQVGGQVTAAAGTNVYQAEAGFAASTAGEVGAYLTTSSGRTSDVLPAVGASISTTVTNASSLADLRGTSTTTSAGGVFAAGTVTAETPDGRQITGVTANLGESGGIGDSAPYVSQTTDTTRMVIFNERDRQ
jgi:hypothetical protein